MAESMLLCRANALCTKYEDTLAFISTLQSCADICGAGVTFAYWSRLGRSRYAGFPQSRCRCCAPDWAADGAADTESTIYYSMYAPNTQVAAKAGCTQRMSTSLTADDPSAMAAAATSLPCPAQHAATIAQHAAALLRRPSTRPPTDSVVSARGSYPAFVSAVLSALSARPLGVPSLTYLVETLATRELARDGLWCEFGVYSGGSARVLVDALRRLGGELPLHGFDSFRGLPERWAHLRRGAFGDRMGTPPFVDEMARWHVGWFNATVPRFAASLRRRAENGSRRDRVRINLLHLDADLYSSTSEVLSALEAFIAPGAFLVFDELHSYEGFEEHELKALYEMMRRTGRKIRVIGHPGPEPPGWRSNSPLWAARQDACAALFEPNTSSPQRGIRPLLVPACATLPGISEMASGLSNGCWSRERPFEAYSTPFDAIVQVL